ERLQLHHSGLNTCYVALCVNLHTESRVPIQEASRRGCRCRAFYSQKIEDWSSDGSGHESHHHKHGEERGGEDTGIVSNLKDDEFDETAGIKHRAEGESMSPRVTRQTRGHYRASHFSGDGSQQHNASPEPSVAVVEKIDARPHPGQREEHGQKETG